MSFFGVRGGNPLQGRVRISGSKNAALALLAAALLPTGEVQLENVPQILDVKIMLHLLETLGVKSRWVAPDGLRFEVPAHLGGELPYEDCQVIRASSLLIGSLLARQREARVPLPGGCHIGPRPLDLHLKGLAALGADVGVEHGFVHAVAPRLEGTKIYLDFPSVGATENLMLAATAAQGQTVLENVAKEPEIVNLASFLNSLGARVRGAGTDVIRVEGPTIWRPGTGVVIPDRIEAGTFMLATVITSGQVTLENVIPLHLQAVTAKVREMGAGVREEEEEITVAGPLEGILPTNIKTMPYPGFPTDLQSPALAVLSLARGTSVVVENVFENRFQAVEELQRMGAQIKVEGQTAVVTGTAGLCGAQVHIPDLRAGAALLLAGLAANGESRIGPTWCLDRGYENWMQKFVSLGAAINLEDKVDDVRPVSTSSNF